MSTTSEANRAEVAPGVHLEFEVRGTGRPLVLLHGLGGNLETDRATAEALATDYRVLWYSCRGAGRSTPLRERAQLTYRLFAADLAGLLEHTGFAQPVLVGGSHGANTALRFITDHPGRAAGVMAIAPGANCLDRPSGLTWVGYRAYYAVLRRRGLDAFVKAITGVDPAAEPDHPQVRAARTHDLEVARANGRTVPGQAAVDRARLAGLDLPVDVVAWPGDVIHPLRVALEVAARIPSARFHEVDRSVAGADPVAKLAALVSLVHDFVARCDDPARPFFPARTEERLTR